MTWLAPVFTGTEHRETQTVPRWFVAADDVPELWQ